MITTKGRLLQDFIVSFSEGEIRICWARFEEGEQLAILIDRMHNNARIYVPFDEAQSLASRHQYELFIPQIISPIEGEPFISRIERFISAFEL